MCGLQFWQFSMRQNCCAGIAITGHFFQDSISKIMPLNYELWNVTENLLKGNYTITKTIQYKGLENFHNLENLWNIYLYFSMNIFWVSTHPITSEYIPYQQRIQYLFALPVCVLRFQAWVFFYFTTHTSSLSARRKHQIHAVNGIQLSWD